MTDDEFTAQIDEALKQHTLALLYRLERLEERYGLRDPANTDQRLPPIETHSERELAKEEIVARIEALEEMYDE